MTIGRLLTTLIALAATAALATGNETRGGGDIVHCQRSTDNELEGAYTLDYVLTYQNQSDRPENFLVPVDSWEESKTRIGRILATKLPEFYKQFKNFIDHMDNYTDYSRDRVWKQSPFELVDVTGEDFLVILPENCYEEEQGRVNLVQAIIYTRYTDTGFVTYLFDHTIYNDLAANRPLQFSFLMIHEWLWDFYQPQSINRMRDLVRLLHSGQMEDLSPQRLWRAMRNLGIPLETLGPQPAPNAPLPETLIRVRGKSKSLYHLGTMYRWSTTSDLNSSVRRDIKDYRLMHPVRNRNSTFIAYIKKDGTALSTLTLPGLPMYDAVSMAAAVTVNSLAILSRWNGPTYWLVGRMEPLPGATSIRLGKGFSCWTSADGFSCQTSDQRLEPFVNRWAAMPMPTLSEYSLGDRYGCFINADELRCYDQHERDFNIPNFDRPLTVKVGQDHACATGDGQLKCWSWGAVGQTAAKFVDVPDIRNPIDFDVAKDYTCAVDEVGVQCWGPSYAFVPEGLYPLQ